MAEAGGEPSAPNPSRVTRGASTGGATLTLSSRVATEGQAFLGVRVSAVGGDAGRGGTDADQTASRRGGAGGAAIVSGVFLLLAPHWPAWDRWDGLVLLAAIGLPLHLIAARGLRGPIRAVRAAADSVVDSAVDGLVDGLAGRRRRARPGLSGADP
ncbi:hypothetical protein [Methylobacterium fujisawaense]|uniref:hypothetical protein n=1 Tax=Methylobacterium fujisawaense TaxID=107400 RepID=UPI002F35138F